MLLFDNEFLPQAIAFITTAQKRIDIATFKAEITSKPRGQRLRLFFDTLFKKKSQGLQIHFLINWNEDKRACPLSNLSAIHELKNHKIPVRILQNNRCCHAKIIIADQDKAIIGSHNLSVKSCHNNFEASYLIQDPVSVARLSVIFERTFINAKLA